MPRLPSRIKGRQSLTRRLRALILAVVRFDRGRACTPHDRVFSARLLDGLRATLAAVTSDRGADPSHGPALGDPVAPSEATDSAFKSFQFRTEETQGRRPVNPVYGSGVSGGGQS